MNKKPFTYIDHTPLYVTRKNVKNFNIRIRAERINVSVPSNVSENIIVKLIDTNREKIRGKLKKLKKKHLNLTNVKPAEVTSIMFLGKKRPVVFSEVTNLSYEDGKFILPDILKRVTYDIFQDNIDKLIKLVLTDIIQEELNKWEAITGLECTGFSIRKMKTRWGSCTPSTGKMRFNFYLAVFSKEVISSVVLHELLHIKERNHQKGFYNLIYKYMPDYDEVQRALKETESPEKYIF